jgi:alpha-1,2-mannosyltransferase
VSYLLQITRTVYHYPEQWMVDLEVYRAAAISALDGGDPYAVMTGPAKELAFLYPPFDLVLVAPLAFVPLWLGAFLWNTLSVAALQFVIRTSWSRAGLPHAARWSIPLTIGCLFLQPIDQNFEVGQLSIVLAALVLADVTMPASSRGKGILIGIATGVKILPGLFIFYYLLTRRWRQAALAAVSALSTVVVGLIVFPSYSAFFWTHRLWSDDRMLPVHWVPNESIRGSLSRVLHSDAAAVAPWLILSGIVIVLTAWAVSRRATRPDAVGVSLTALATLLVAPISWHHYWVWAIPIVIELFALSWRTRSTHLFCAVTLFVVVIAARVNRWFVPDYNGYDALRLGDAQLLGINIVTYVTLILFAVLVVYRLHRRPEPCPTDFADLVSDLPGKSPDAASER